MFGVRTGRLYRIQGIVHSMQPFALVSREAVRWCSANPLHAGSGLIFCGVIGAIPEVLFEARRMRLTSVEEGLVA
jgi:hypothetical protein